MPIAIETQAFSVPLADVGVHDLHHALRHDGLWLDVGAATLQVRSDSRVLARQLQQTYPAFPFVRHADWSDCQVRISRPHGLRRWAWPQIELFSDGRRPFDPFPADSPLPLFEWGCNWLIGQRLNHLLLLHAGVVERDGLALVMPALPGSGKSTLTAALSQRGWRLLSDEFGAFDPEGGVFRAMLKPVALKNQSIAVLRRFALQFEVGLPGPRERAAILARYLTRHDLEVGGWVGGCVVWVCVCVRVIKNRRARAQGF